MYPEPSKTSSMLFTLTASQGLKQILQTQNSGIWEALATMCVAKKDKSFCFLEAPLHFAAQIAVYLFSC